MLANSHACTGIDGGVYGYVEALCQVFTPGSKEQTTLCDTNFNHASCHPMAKYGIDGNTFFMYLEEVAKCECFEHTVNEFAENTTNFCQNNTSMSKK